MRLYAKSIRYRRPIFFIAAQPVDASSKNALLYDDCTSGSIIYAYVHGNPINFVDPMGLAEYEGLGTIVRHLSQLARAQGDNFWKDRTYAAERAMLGRLQRGEETPYDVAFYRHEMAEAQRCEPALRWPLEKYLDAQREAHRFVERAQRDTWADRYHPDVIRRLPDLFGFPRP